MRTLRKNEEIALVNFPFYTCIQKDSIFGVDYMVCPWISIQHISVISNLHDL